MNRAAWRLAADALQQRRNNRHVTNIEHRQADDAFRVLRIEGGLAEEDLLALGKQFADGLSKLLATLCSHKARP